jgi:hypothetical protein
MRMNQHEILTLPDSLGKNPAREVLRVLRDYDNTLHVSVTTSPAASPRNWGVVLVDVARAIAQKYAAFRLIHGIPEDKIFAGICDEWQEYLQQLKSEATE